MKQYGLLSILLLLSFGLQAQQQFEFSLGYTSSLTYFTDRPIIEQGVNTNVLAKPLPSHTFMVNGTVGYMITKHFGVITGAGLLGVQQRYSMGFPQPSANHNAIYTRNLTYLRLPIALRLQMPVGEKWTIYGQAGIHGDFLLNSNENLQADGNATNTRDLSDTYNNSVMGLSGELGVMYQFTPHTSLMLGVHGSTTLTTPGGDDANYNVYGGSQSPTIGHVSPDLSTLGLRIGLRQTINLRSTP